MAALGLHSMAFIALISSWATFSALLLLSATASLSLLAVPSSAAALQISDVSLLLPRKGGVRKTVRASPGCFLWHSTCPQSVQLSSLDPSAPVEATDEYADGAEADDDVDCSPWPGSSDHTRIVYNPSAGGDDEEENLPGANATHRPCKLFAIPAADAVYGDSSNAIQVEVYLSPIERIEVLTTARTIGVGSSETLELQAFDALGNVFSTLQGLEFTWTASDDEPLKLSPLRESNVISSPTERTVEAAPGVYGPKVEVTGQRTGTVELTVGYQGSLGAKVLLDVTETLSPCPDASPEAIVLLEGHSLPMEAFLVKPHAQKTNVLVRIPSEHADEYAWEASGAAVEVDASTGMVAARAAGSATVIIRDRIIDHNYEQVPVDVVRASDASLGMLLAQSSSVLSKTAVERSRASLCPWRSRGVLPHAMFLPYGKGVWTDRTDPSWVMVLNWEYYVLADLRDAKRRSVFPTRDLKLDFRASDSDMLVS